MKMGRHFPGPVFAALTLAFPILAAEQSAWLDERQTLFAQWQSTNPEIRRHISELKSLTAELVSQHRARKQAEDEERRGRTDRTFTDLARTGPTADPGSHGAGFRSLELRQLRAGHAPLQTNA